MTQPEAGSNRQPIRYRFIRWTNFEPDEFHVEKITQKFIRKVFFENSGSKTQYHYQLKSIEWWIFNTT